MSSSGAHAASVTTVQATTIATRHARIRRTLARAPKSRFLDGEPPFSIDTNATGDQGSTGQGAHIMTTTPVLIGKAIGIKGEVYGEEDLVIEGRVEGIITLKKNHVTLERSAVIDAQVEAENITIKGEVRGNSVASDKVEITADANIVGDIKAPRIVMEEGAKFKGSVQMDVKLPPGI